MEKTTHTSKPGSTSSQAPKVDQALLRLNHARKNPVGRGLTDIGKGLMGSLNSWLAPKGPAPSEASIRQAVENPYAAFTKHAFPISFEPSGMIGGVKSITTLANRFKLLYNGPQEGVGSKIVGHLFTDPKTQGTFMVRGLKPTYKDIASKMRTLRRRFEGGPK